MRMVPKVYITYSYILIASYNHSGNGDTIFATLIFPHMKDSYNAVNARAEIIFVVRNTTEEIHRYL